MNEDRQPSLSDMVKRYKVVFESDEGKEVLSDLIKITGFFDSVFNENPHVMAFNEGQRALVARILRTVNVTPQELENLENHINNSTQEIKGEFDV